jgi:hypothetical protein
MRNLWLEEADNAVESVTDRLGRAIEDISRFLSELPTR